MNKKTIYKGISLLITLSVITSFFIPLTPIYANAKEENTTNSIKNGNVLLEENEDQYIFGNGHLKRTFNTANQKLRTENITNYRTTPKTVLIPETGSEEFIITTLPNGTEDTIKNPTERLDSSKWKSSSDSIATNENGNGDPSKMFDGDNNTYYHSKYEESATKEEHEFPHNIYVDLNKLETIQSLRYQLRLYEDGSPTASGHVKDFNIYIADNIDELKTSTTPILSGTFENKKETYINFNNAITTQFIRIEFVNGYEPEWETDPEVACCSEFDFFSDKIIYPETGITTIKSSDLSLAKKPVFETNDTEKKLTFTFQPIVIRNVEYTIKEIITMKDNDSFMRKHLEITVPEKDAKNAKIDYIDLENMNFSNEVLQPNHYWTIPEQADNPDMSNMKGDYLELGQPYYIAAMYWGCEFPQTENKIRNNNGYIRYHFGKSLAKDAHFTYNKNNEAAHMITWDSVVGSARSSDYSVVQSDFFDYIETIATKTDFRQQFNSWYDYMYDINANNIKDSFYEIEKGFTQHGVAPLDSYVVDDGWANYNSFWDFNEKFPNEFYDTTLQTSQLGSNFGLWLGPRGGYNGTQHTISNWIEQHNLGSINRVSWDVNVSDARYLSKLVSDIFTNYQEKFNINYWKLDGMLFEPETNPTPYHVTGSPFYTISETYERWSDMFENMRKQRGNKDLWINMTSFVNPSPWHLQWVNSIWMQNTGDTGYDYSFNATDQEAMLTYRDSDYYDFFNNRQWQLPNKYFYNHDPVYAKTAHNVGGGPGRPINYTNEELREHLYMLGTRGTAFWEYYYSNSMFDDDKWDINAQAANWIENNFDILQKSKMFGGNPANGDIYGYSCWNGNDGIVSLRNPSNQTKTYTITFNRLIGVNENIENLYPKVVIGDVEKYQTNKPLSYNQKITYTLNPKEVVIIQYGKKDTTSASISAIHGDKNKVEVTFDETIRTPKKDYFNITNNTIEDIQLKEDLRTVELILKHEVIDASTIELTVNGVQDIVGNKTIVSAIEDYYENDIVNSIVNRKLDGKEIPKGNVYSIDGTKGFAITGTIKTESKNAEILRQEDAYSLAIDKDGYLTFTLNGINVNSKYIQKTKQNNDVISETKGLIADGKEHQFSAVKEVNGMLKLYLDAELVASKYDENHVNPTLKKGNLVFGKNLIGETNYITVLDRPLAYDEITNFVDLEGNAMMRPVNKNVSISAFDVNENKPVSELSAYPFSNLNDGNKNYKNNYMELHDTSDGKNHSRYVEIDLGEKYELYKIHLTRYADNRTYGPTVIALSNDKDFNDKKIVYNSDHEGNIHNLGKGNDSLYPETTQGKEISFSPIKARYIRIYVSGNNDKISTSDHFVEFEAYGKKDAKTIYRIDYSNLAKLINEDLYSTYTMTSIQTYYANAKDIINKAEDLIKYKNANSDEEVEILISSIQKQQNVLVKRANTEKAKVALKQLNQLYEEDYTKESWGILKTAKSNLEHAILDTSDINENQMNELISALEKAIDNLIEINDEVDASKLEKLYNDYLSLKQENYTKNTYMALQDALKEAKIVIDKKDKTIEEVEQAYQRLIKAIDGLQMITHTNAGKDQVSTGDSSSINIFVYITMLTGAISILLLAHHKYHK